MRNVEEKWYINLAFASCESSRETLCHGWEVPSYASNPHCCVLSTLALTSLKLKACRSPIRRALLDVGETAAARNSGALHTVESCG